jgi:YidC/Oxa1 family membrane protein insertase
LHLLIAANWLLDPIVSALWSIIWLIHTGVGNLGLSLIILAACIRLIFWPLNTAQFKAMINMQKVAPKLKKLQERFKNDQQRLQKETMQLYKESGANPLAGCWPTLVQLPILISVYYAVIYHRQLFMQQSFLWIGSSLAAHVPHFLAGNLADADLLLVLIYMVSQYVAMRFTTMPPTDPAQAQQLKIMQVISPLMIGFIGFKANWPSAMVLYWLSYNLFTMAQQLYLLRKYHEPLSFIDSDHVISESAETPEPKPPAISANGTATTRPRSKKKTKGTKS